MFKYVFWFLLFFNGGFLTSPPPPDVMLDDSSASLSLRTTLHRGGGGKVEFGPKHVCFHVKNWSMVEAVHSASLSHIILARIVASRPRTDPGNLTTLHKSRRSCRLTPPTPKRRDRFQISPAAWPENITPHSMKNLACHSLLVWKMITLPILT